MHEANIQFSATRRTKQIFSSKQAIINRPDIVLGFCVALSVELFREHFPFNRHTLELMLYENGKTVVILFK